MNEQARVLGQTKTLLLSVPIEPAYDPPIKAAAGRANRKVADYIRNLVLEDLRRQELIAEDYLPHELPGETSVPAPRTTESA